MTLPSVNKLITDRRSSSLAAPSVGNWFPTGYTLRGRTDKPILVTSMAQKELLCGERTAETAVLHDSLEAFFRVGGRNAYVNRVVGPDAAVATDTLPDSGADDSITFNANSPGEWGNEVDVIVVKTSSTFTVRVDYNSVTVEQSPSLSSVAEAVAWASVNSDYIEVVDEGNLIPESGTANLAGGDADVSSAGTPEVIEALSHATLSYGPGQVSCPGMTSAAVHEAVMEHAAAFTRIGLCDEPDSSDTATIAAAATALRTEAGARLSGGFWPWLTIPGLAVGTTRTVPPSAIQAGMTARAASSGKNPGDPIAGKLGATDYPLGLSQEPLSDSAREALNDAGVNVIIEYGNEVRTYGNRTYANPITDANWSQLSQSRTVMAVAAIAEEVGQDFFERKIDGRGFTLADFGQEMAGRACLPFYLSDDLYGSSPEEAFKVDVGPEVNPPADIAAGKLRAAISLRTSPGADMVTIEIVKIPTGENL